MDTSEQYIQMCAALPAEMHYLLGFDNGDQHKFPRLDKILELAAEHGGSIGGGFFTLRHFYDFVESKIEKTPEWRLKFSTLEQMALCYVMWLKYEMVWTGSAWEEGEYLWIFPFLP